MPSGVHSIDCISVYGNILLLYSILFLIVHTLTALTLHIGFILRVQHFLYNCFAIRSPQLYSLKPKHCRQRQVTSDSTK